MLTQPYVGTSARCRCSMANIIANIPNYYRRAALFEPHQTYITVKADTQVRIGDGGYISTADVDLQLSDCLSASARAGVDLYVYACRPDDEESSEPVFVISQNSTVPDGYDADSSRKIGGFHCLCSAVGTISGHELSGYATGDVLPNSVWDLRHRAASENEGMVWVEGVGKWVDIYLASIGSDGRLASAYGGSVVSGTTATPMHGEKFVEELGLVGKRLVFRDDFVVFAKGGNEGTNIQGSANPGTTGGHVDTDSRRMITNYGLEDCAGAFYQWTGDVYAFTNFDIQNETYATLQNALWRGNVQRANHFCSLMRWDLYAADPEYGGTDYDGSSNQTGHSRIYHVDVDGDETDKFGDMYGALARALVGASWGSGSRCGSRSVNLNALSTRVDSNRAARGASGPRAVGEL